MLALTAAMLWFAIALPAIAKTLKLDGAEGQRASNLCWAASSVTALRMLRTPRELQENAEITTQDKLAAYSMVFLADRVTTDPNGDPIDLERLTTKQVAGFPADKRDFRIEQCGGSLGKCNRVNGPVLLDTHFDTTDDGVALNWPNIVEQIDSNRPVVFSWTTKGPHGRDLGPHYSVVTGYRVRRGAREVRLWDPWPVSETGHGGQHTQWIPYCTYRSPQSVMGVKARHQSDRYNLTRVFDDTPSRPRRSSPANITADSECPTAPGSDRSAAIEAEEPRSISAVQDAFRDEDSIRETLKRSAIPRRALFSRFAPGLPIVAVSSHQLEEAEGDADELLVDRSNSVLVPVTRGRATIDSFLVLRDGREWAPGGYANTQAAALLVAQRQRLDLGDVYMVSIPALNTFFLAHGVGANASLIPIANNAALGATAGEARKASFFFPRLLDILRNPDNGPG
jgi:hypothetical protein